MTKLATAMGVLAAVVDSRPQPAKGLEVGVGSHLQPSCVDLSRLPRRLRANQLQGP